MTSRLFAPIVSTSFAADCLSQPTVADDGTQDLGGILQVNCSDGTCTTTYFLE